MESARRRRQFVGLAMSIVVLGLLHHLDHAFRGNHSGWPITDAVTPFTFSLLIYPLLFYGIARTRGGAPVARYWLVVGLVLAALLTFVHYVPVGKYERISTDLYLPYVNPYADPRLFNLAPPEAHRIWFQKVYGPHTNALWGWLAVAIVIALTLCAYALVVVAALAQRERRYFTVTIAAVWTER